MRKWHLADTHETVPATFAVDEEDGIQVIHIANWGTVFQRVSDKFLRSLDVYHRRVWDYWFRSLNRRELDTRCSWYMRRGKRFLPWWAWWQIASAKEWVVLNLLRLGFIVVSRFRNRAAPCGMRLGWRNLLRYLWKGNKDGSNG